MLPTSPAYPIISCFTLPVAEYHRRTDIAEDLEEQMQQRNNRPDGRYGREIMWHPSFPTEFISLMGNMPLHEVGPWLLDCHAASYNGGKALDLLDYCYLADVLREGLANTPTPLATLRLARALTWVEQAGKALLTAQAALPLAASITDEPLMSAAA